MARHKLRALNKARQVKALLRANEANELYLATGSEREVARQMKISRRTVRRLLNRIREINERWEKLDEANAAILDAEEPAAEEAPQVAVSFIDEDGKLIPVKQSAAPQPEPQSSSVPIPTPQIEPPDTFDSNGRLQRRPTEPEASWRRRLRQWKNEQQCIENILINADCGCPLGPLQTPSIRADRQRKKIATELGFDPNEEAFTG